MKKSVFNYSCVVITAAYLEKTECIFQSSFGTIVTILSWNYLTKKAVEKEKKESRHTEISSNMMPAGNQRPLQ